MVRRRLSAEQAVPATKGMEVKHPAHTWVDPSFAQESLSQLIAEYMDHLSGRSQPVSQHTIDKYRKALLSMTRSLERQTLPLILESVTPQAINTWIQEQRKMGRAEDGIASRLGAVKVFTNRFIYKHAELTTRDLLLKIPRIIPPEKPAQVLTEEEIETVLNCFDLPNWEDARNRALVAVYISTGLRLREVLELPFSSLNIRTGQIRGIRAKGNKEREAWISEGGMKYVRAYLSYRRKYPEDAPLWLQSNGRPLTYWGAHSIMKRLRVRCGIVRMHWHLFRHGFAQTALKRGAEIGTVQEMLGHASNTMTRRYAGQVRQSEAAKRMPRYAPI
ncbi:MAG: tyrosine-type recombinase/integrase [Chloroflexi bacterium]|nr:tyrosine-type recombinase/integrase [Chloroflexota bacterium]